MQSDYDPAKRQINLEKHGVDFLALASVFEELNRLEGLDERRTSAEERWICLGRNGFRLCVVVDTMRGNRIRIISARKANDREQQKYSDSNSGRI
jgi:uncharacterized DUF497 family protein